MGWGEKAIEIRSVETGHLDGVFMHKRAQRLKFLCERNDKVTFSFHFFNKLFQILTKFKTYHTRMHYFSWQYFGIFFFRRVHSFRFLLTSGGLGLRQVFFASVRPGGASQVYFMTLGRTSLMSW